MKEMQKTVLIVTPLYPPDIGGPATYADILMKEMGSATLTPRVLSFGEVRHLPRVLRHVVFAWKVWRESKCADVLLVLDPVSVGFPTYLATRFRSVPYVLKVVGDYAWEQGVQRYAVTANLDEFVLMPSRLFHPVVGLMRMIEIQVARNADWIIVPSQYLAGIVAAWGISRSTIDVVYNAFLGVDVPVTQSEVRRSLDISGKVIVSAGRLVPWKGFALLIDVVSALRATYPDLTLYIAGSGPDEALLRSQIHAKGESEHVILLGQVPKAELALYVKSADVFVLHTGYEGLSHQLLEVLAIGTPIVTTHVGGNGELITHQKTGLLVPYHDESALMDATRYVLEHPKDAHRMSEAGKAFVAQFSVRHMVAETAQVFIKNNK
jgi:glycosyltransferase involved in cell wall biosynthesis